jgi:hypothetical protein
MNIFLKGLVAIAAISLPATAFAQSSDAAYCKALANQYERYLDSGLRLGVQPQSLRSKLSLAECRAGNTRGIPGLEQALRDAKVDLPARAATSAAASDKKLRPRDLVDRPDDVRGRAVSEREHLLGDEVAHLSGGSDRDGPQAGPDVKPRRQVPLA